MKYSEKFRVKPGNTVRLNKIDAAFKDKHEDQGSALVETEKYTHRLRELQYLLYAEGKRSLLIVLQAMDAGGKDGTINHVLGSMNPQGARVYGFKVPSAEEAAHDFLWRIHRAAPQRGQVAIFNRSHYEDVLISRVHGFVPKKVWSKRYELINDFEKNLVDSGTHILKFYLHISEEEQLRRFKQRIDDPARHWKISESDYRERSSFDQAYVVMNVLSTIVACYGLLDDSAAVVIGAMIIAMLLCPISGMGLALVDGRGLCFSGRRTLYVNKTGATACRVARCSHPRLSI
jgi:PPK2 family polyphosphate:nucleotide phosphotransferase